MKKKTKHRHRWQTDGDSCMACGLMRETSTSIIHRLAHILRWNYGDADAFYDTDGELMMSFVCTGCGERSMIHKVDYDETTGFLS